MLHGDDFAGVHLDAQKHGVIANERPTVEQLVRHESGKSKSEGIRFMRGALEVHPRRIGDERLGDTSLASKGTLLEQGECYGMGEWPLEKGIVVARKDLDVYGDVSSLAWAVTVEEHRCLQFVPVLAGVEWRRDQLETILALCFDHFGRPVCNLPKKGAGVVGAQFGHGVLQHGDLLSLTTRQGNHQRQMSRGVGFQVGFQQMAWSFEATAGFFEGTWD